MKEDKWTQAERENKKEINQLSKTLLKKAGGYPEQGSLYCLQLALWEVENAPLDIETKPLLREWLERLAYHWNPTDAMAMLETEGEDEIMALMEYAKTDMSDPIEVAIRILDQLDSRLTELTDSYPPAPKNYR